jgi:ABC-type phosphate transport system substrate-binding protein
MLTLKRLFSVVLLVACAAPLWARDLAVVINKGNAETTVTLAELAKMVKGANKKWPDGRECTIVVSDLASPTMKQVVQKLFGGTVDEAKSSVVATNKSSGRPYILIVANDDAVLHAVETMPSAVGFVDVYSITGAVKPLKVDDKLPLEPGYALHGQ